MWCIVCICEMCLLSCRQATSGRLIVATLLRLWCFQPSAFLPVRLGSLLIGCYAIILNTTRLFVKLHSVSTCSEASIDLHCAGVWLASTEYLIRAHLCLSDDTAKLLQSPVQSPTFDCLEPLVWVHSTSECGYHSSECNQLSQCRGRFESSW